MELFVSLSVDQAKTLVKDCLKEALQELPPENPATLPRYRTRAEVRDTLGISYPTLDKFIRLGLIRSHRIGKRLYFTDSDIQAALKTIPVKYSVR